MDQPKHASSGVAADEGNPEVIEPGEPGSPDHKADAPLLRLYDDSNSPHEFRVTPQLRELFARADEINRQRNSFDVTFSSLLLGFLTGTDSTCSWVRSYFSQQGIIVDHLYKRVGMNKADVDEAALRATKKREAWWTSAALRESPSARRAIEEATLIARAQQSPAVDILHLVAAFISLPNYHDEDFGSLGLDRLKWGLNFFHHVARTSGNERTVEFWRQSFMRWFQSEPPPDLNAKRALLSGYNADAYTADDLLDISDEVRSLAYVIASTKVQPPLAIGLFGEWGSGKTFFMRHLRRRVEALCKSASKQAPKERALCGHIAQIEFNAWHYQEGNLWASLVDHILRNLRFGEDEDEAKLEQRCEALLRELESTTQRTETTSQYVEELKQRTEKADERLAQLQAEQETRRSALAEQLSPGQVLSAARRAITLNPELRVKGQELLGKLGVDNANLGASELHGALLDAKKELNGLGGLLLPLLRAPDRGKRTILLIATIAAPAVVGCGIAWALSAAGQDWIGKIAGLLAAAGSFLTTGAGWLKSQTKWLKDLNQQLTPVVRDVDDQIRSATEQELGEQAKQIAVQLGELDALKEQQAAAQKEKEQAAAEAAKVRVALANAGSDNLLRTFLDERIQQGEYQKRLGIAALVRRDFERLSRHLESFSKRELAGTIREDELPLNRIVLYIDDLDRCDAAKVVEVLRAVHLLLAFPAFVAVVGVDSRWVAHCLERYLEDLVVDEGDGPTIRTIAPLDYLEKIFQIPIWLEPVPVDRRISMARHLLRPRPTDPATRAGAASTEGGNTNGKAGGPSTTSTHAGAAIASSHTLSGALPSQTSDSPEPNREPIDLNPSGLDIIDRENQFLDQLGPFLSPSPRVIKRFVNTYRLIKVGLPDEPTSADSRVAPCEIRMLLLAIFVSSPELSRALQHALRREGIVTSDMTLVALMDAYLPNEAVQLEWRKQAYDAWLALRKWLTSRVPTWESAQASAFVEPLDQVARYTFNLTRSQMQTRTTEIH